MLITSEAGKAAGFGLHPVTMVNHYSAMESSSKTKSDKSHNQAMHYSLIKTRISKWYKFWIPSINLSRYGCEETDHTPVYQPYADENSSDSKGCPDNQEQQFPVILEYLPYRKSGYTFERDYRRHPWFSSHGYVCARVDLRGAGDSDGFLYDEYLKQELDDAVEIIAWFEKQPWCNGKVGMYGKSWGGLNGLQVAYCQPPALKTIISLYSTEDRYERDIHYEGGCVLGVGMLDWSTYMFAYFNPLPPDPRFVPNWKERWIERLQKTGASWVKTWLSHQMKDDYWLHGSIGQQPSRLQIPVLAIGGWRDPYHDVVFELAQSLPVVRCILGPWGHNWPDLQCPGPTIDYLEECLNWWDCHLKEEDNGVMDVPLLRLYQRESIPPKQDGQSRGDWPGKWITENNWPPHSKDERNVSFVPDNVSGTLLPAKEVVDQLPEMSRMAWFKSSSGAWCGEWIGFGGPDAPGDQQVENATSLSWTSAELSNKINILGSPQLEVNLKVCGGTRALLAACLSDVFPDGRSTLITHGILNLTHHRGHSKEDVEELVPGRFYNIPLTLHSTSYIVPKGHRLCLSVSPNYWPLAWPSPTPVNLEVFTGSKVGDPTSTSKYCTVLSIPTCPETSENITHVKGLQHFGSGQPKIGPAAQVHVLREPFFDVSITKSLSTGLNVRKVVSDEGRKLIKEMEMIKDCKKMITCTIEDGDPLSARVDITWDVKLEWLNVKGGIKVDINTESQMWSDERTFFVKNVLMARLDDEEVFNKSWEESVPRQLV